MREESRVERRGKAQGLKSDFKKALGKAGRVFLSIALVCLMSPATSLALDSDLQSHEASSDERPLDGLDDEESASSSSASASDEESEDADSGDELRSDASASAGEGESSDEASSSSESSSGSSDASSGSSATEQTNAASDASDVASDVNGTEPEDADGEEYDDEDSDDEDDDEEDYDDEGSSSEGARKVSLRSGDLSSDDIAIVAKANEVVLSTYPSEDMMYTASDNVTLEVSVAELQEGDKVKVEGSESYNGLSTEETVDDKGNGSFTKSITLSTPDQAYTGSVKVTVTRGEASVDKTFNSGITIDTLKPQVTGFKFSRSAVSSKLNDDTNEEKGKTEYFNLDDNGTLGTLKLVAMLTEANLVEGSNKLVVTRLEDAKTNVADATWTSGGAGVYNLEAEFKAENFVSATSGALLVAQAYITASDKAGHVMEPVYPSVTDDSANPATEKALDTLDYFTAENALIDTLKVTPSYSNTSGIDVSPTKKADDETLYFNDTVNMSSIGLSSDVVKIKGTDIEDNDYVLTIGATNTYDKAKVVDGSVKFDNATLSKANNANTTYSNNSLKVTTEHGATGTINLSDVMVVGLGPTISIDWNKTGGTGVGFRTINAGQTQYVYNGTNAKPTITLKVANPVSLTSRDDVKLVFKDDDGQQAILSGTDITWGADGGDGSWNGTATVEASAETVRTFSYCTAYQLESATARSVFDAEEDEPSVKANVTTTPFLFMVDNAKPVVTIAFQDALVKDGESDSVVKFIINAVKKTSQNGNIVITVEDDAFDAKSTTIKLNNTTSHSSASWVPVPDTKKSTYTIPFNDSTLTDGVWTLNVHAVDYAGNNVDYYVVQDADNATKTAEKFTVDTKSPEFDLFALYTDEACTSAATASNASTASTDGVELYTDKPLYGKLVVKDLDLDAAKSTVTITKGREQTAFDGSSILVGDPWVKSETPDASGLYEYTSIFKFDQGSMYSLSLTANDVAENESLTREGDEVHKTFSVDADGPEVVVSIDKPVVGTTATEDASGATATVDWYAAKPTATVTVYDDDTNFSSDDITVSPQAPSSQTAPTVSEPTNVANGFQYTIEFDDDTALNDDGTLGLYGIQVEAADTTKHTTNYSYGGETYGATFTNGATKTPSTSSGFVVDTAAPTVEVTTTAQRVRQATIDVEGAAKPADYFTDTAAMKVTVTDDHFDPENSDVAYTGTAADDNDAPTIPATWTRVGTTNQWQKTVTFKDSAFKGPYALTVFAPDAVYALDEDDSHSLGHGSEYAYGANQDAKDDATCGKLATLAGVSATGGSGGSAVNGACFVVDTKAPDVSIAFEKAAAATKTKDDEKIDYFDSFDSNEVDYLTAIITVVDANFDDKSTIEATNGEVVNTSGVIWQKQDPEAGQPDLGEYRAVVRYENTPANETADLAVTAIDSAHVNPTSGSDQDNHVTEYSYGGTPKSGSATGGNVSTTIGNGSSPTKTTSDAFVVDCTTPEVSLTATNYTSGPFTEQWTLNDELAPADFYSENMEVAVSVQCAHLSKTTSWIQKTAADGTLGDKEAVWWSVASADGGEYSYNIRFGGDSDPGAAYTYTVHIEDEIAGASNDADVKKKHSWDYTYKDTKVGTRALASNVERFAIDTKVPEVNVTLDQSLVGSEGDVDYFGSMTEGALTATVQVVSATFPGNADITAAGGEVVTSGDAVWTQDATRKDVWSAKVQYAETEAGKTCGLALNPKTLAQKSTSYVYGSNTESTTTKAKDDVALNGKGFVIDVTAPTVSVAIKDADGQVLSPVWTDTMAKIDYYNQLPFAHVEIKDRNFEPNTALSTIAAAGCIDANSLKWSKTANDTWNAVIPYGENLNTVAVDKSSLQLRVVDKVYAVAGNGGKPEGHDASWAYPGGIGTGATDFVADLAAPIVSISIGQAVKGTNASVDYYNGDVPLTVSVTSRNFDPVAGQKPGVIVVKDGAQLSSEQLGEWTHGSAASDGKVTWKNTITFDTESLHTLEVTAANKSLYEASASYRDANTRGSTSFIVDKTDPTVAISLNQKKQNTGSDGIDYFSADVVATLTVVDVNFKTSDTEVFVDGNKSDTAQWRNPSYDGKTWVATVSYQEGVQHTVQVKAADWAQRITDASYGDAAGKDGNASILGSTDRDGTALTGKSFTIDETKPVLSFKVNQEKIATHNGVDYFSNIKTSDSVAVITVTVEELNFNPDSPLNVVTKNDVVQKDVVWKSAGSSKWTTEVSYAEGANNTLAVTVGDWANNSRSLNYGKSSTDSKNSSLSSQTFAVDLTAPKVESAQTDTDSSNNYGKDYYFYDKATRLTVDVTDNIGLRSVNLVDVDEYYNKEYYIVSDTKQGAKSKKVVVEFADGQEFDRNITLETVDLANNSRTWSISPSGEVTDVTGSSRNNASPVTDAHPRGLIQDTVNPTLAFSGVDAGAYYNSEQSVALDVNELNFRYLKSFDATQRIITVSKVAGDAGAAEESWDIPVSDFEEVNANQKPAGLDGLYRHNEGFAGDGHYSLSATLTDPAGNTVTAQQGEFTVDMTAPSVSVEFDNNAAINSRYYDRARTATITITEHNFDSSLVNIDTTGSVGTWSDSGDVHTTTVSYTSDGNYTLSISGQDRAGNAIPTYTVDEFVIDLIDPVITFSGVEDSSAFNAMVMPSIMFADEANFDASGTQYTLTGTKHGAVNYASATQGGDNMSTVTFNDFGYDTANDTYNSEYDDIYTIDAQMTDMAGRSDQKTVTFSVNRYGSNFRIIDQEAYQRNDGYLSEPQEVRIEEVNVSGCDSEKHGVTVTAGTDVSQLELHDSPQSTGYVIESSTSENSETRGWVSYVYRVAADNFTKEGSYHVAVNSDDRATNKNTSSSYYDRADGKSDSDAEVSFVLDQTPPLIQNLNIAQDAVYDAETYDGSFTVVENIGVKSVQVKLDGEAVDAKADNYGNYRFEVPSKSFVSRTLDVEVQDLAGLDDEANITRFTVTTDPFELHLPFIVGGSVAGCVVIGGAAFAFIRLRRPGL